jgi:hypothetical protein
MRGATYYLHRNEGEDTTTKRDQREGAEARILSRYLALESDTRAESGGNKEVWIDKTKKISEDRHLMLSSSEC